MYMTHIGEEILVKKPTFMEIATIFFSLPLPSFSVTLVQNAIMVNKAIGSVKYEGLCCSS